MRVFDLNGDFIGRAYPEDHLSCRILTPDGATYARATGDVEDSIQRGFWLAQIADPAVLGKWILKEDLPSPTPGQSFDDGYRLAEAEVYRRLERWTRLPSWIYEDPVPPPLTGDDFNDGFITGISTTNHRLLREKFKDSPKPKVEPKTWRNTKFGVDPTDFGAIYWYQRGYELSEDEDEWLPELNAHQQVDQLADEIFQNEGRFIKIQAFRLGFQAGMEARFPNRY